MGSKPAGPVGNGTNRCLVCRRLFGPNEEAAYFGYDGNSTTEPFAGYLCLKGPCQDVYKHYSEEEQIAAVFGSLAGGLALIHKYRQGTPGMDDAAAEFGVIEFAKDEKNPQRDASLPDETAVIENPLLDGTTLEPIRDHAGRRMHFFKIARRAALHFRRADTKSYGVKKW